MGKIACAHDHVERGRAWRFCPRASGEIFRVGIARALLDLFDGLSGRNAHPTARNNI
jgi:hypothetical protein